MKKLSTNNEPSWAGYKLFEFVKNEFESLVDLLSCPRGFIAFKGEREKDRGRSQKRLTSILSLAGKAVEKLHRFLSRLFFKAKLNNLLRDCATFSKRESRLIRSYIYKSLGRSSLASFILKTNKSPRGLNYVPQSNHLRKLSHCDHYRKQLLTYETKTKHIIKAVRLAGRELRKRAKAKIKFSPLINGYDFSFSIFLSLNLFS